MGDTGLELDRLSGREDNHLEIHENPSGAKSGAVAGGSATGDAQHSALTDPDLNFVITTWTTLPPVVRAAVVALVRASTDNRG
jgi:hypothetical protein